MTPAVATRRKKLGDESSAPIINITTLIDHAADSGEPQSQDVTITPELSAEWLDRSARAGALNRPVHQAWVEMYAAAMKAGEWRLTGESIKLDRNGLVRDGQHRLFACIEAGAPFRSTVRINVDEDAFDVMDSGHARTNADVLALHEVDNARTAASVARTYLLWEMYGAPQAAGRPLNPSKPQIVRWIAANKGKYEHWMAQAQKMRKAGFPGGEGTWGAILYRIQTRSGEAEELNAFVERLLNGVGLEAKNPVLALRERLRQAVVRKERLSQVEVAALTIKAWNAWRDGETMQILGWRRGGSAPEKFPEPR